MYVLRSGSKFGLVDLSVTDLVALKQMLEDHVGLLKEIAKDESISAQYQEQVDDEIVHWTTYIETLMTYLDQLEVASRRN